MVSFVFFFLIHGVVSIIPQVTILRELMSNFFGNELFVGIILGIWLLGAGVGCFLGLKVWRNIKTKKACFSLQLLVFLSLPLLIFLTRFFVGKTLLPGETPSFFSGFLFVLGTVFPFCFFLDSLFPLGGKLWAKSDLSFWISRAYLWETIGIALGGFFFNFFLVSSTFPFPASLNNRSLKFRYPNLVEAVNSRYGSIMVTKIGGQANFYESGSLLGTNEEREGSEYFIHTIFAFQQDPKNVLFIGGGLNGPLFEILKYESVEKVDYVELDPKLVEIQTKYLPADLAEVLNNPKVKTHFLDARRFLKQAKESYDIIIFNLPNPSTALLNRFYTNECFQEVKKLLTDTGIFAFTLDVPVDYLSEEAKSLVASIDKTTKDVFLYRLILPEETSILFLSSKTPLPTENKLGPRPIETLYFTPQYLSYRLTSKKIDQIKDLLVEEKPRINTDFSPSAYFYQTAFWQTTQSFQLAKILRGTEKISWMVLILFSLLLLLLLKKRLPSLVLSMGMASFTLMTIEVLIIFLFQSRLGYLYSRIALIFTTILISMGIGNIIGTKIATPFLRHPELVSGSESFDKLRTGIPNQVRNDFLKKALRSVKLLILLYLLLFFPIIKNLAQEPVFYLLGGVIGILVGAVFPLTNKLYLKNKEKVGVLYATDLFGAFFGALLPSLFFIPLFGVQKTILLLIIFNLLTLK